MINDFIQQRLRSAFPEKSDPLTSRAVREGILLADDLIDTNEILKTLIGKDLRGHVRRAGVMMKLHDFCASGDLPFGAEFKRMPIGSWHFLELKSGAVTAHVHKTESAGAFPKDTPTRQLERVTNQPDLFADENVVPFSQIMGEGPFNAWLTFGAGEGGKCGHITWRVPASDDDDWLASIDVLQSAAKSIATPPSEKTPSPKEKMRFKDHVEAAIERSNKSDKQENE